MEKDKKDIKADLKNAAAGAGKAAAGLFNKAKKAVVNLTDQNDDGTFDLQDIAVIRQQMAEKRDMNRREKELKALRPIFEDDISSPEFFLPKLLRVAIMDKRHAESEVCAGSVGFEADVNGLRVLTIYPEKLHLFGLRFYPDIDSEIYYVDPYDRDHYIAMNEYFRYLRIARISELQSIAQSLGAKHFRVTYIEQTKMDNAEVAVAKGAAKFGAGKDAPKEEAEYSHDSFSAKKEKVEIAAEMEFLGHEPVEPTLMYLQKDLNIRNLIDFRMSQNATLHQKTRISLSNSSGIKVQDAMKIDSALSEMKYSASVKITSEAHNEENSMLEYEIDY